MDFSKLSPEQMKIGEMVISEAERQKIDPNLALAQAFQESNLTHGPSKESDAFGVFQIRPGTAKQNNLGDITDIKANIYGGVSLMKRYLDAYKSPELALLAYHQGPGVVDDYLKNKDPSVFGPKGKDYVVKISEAGGFGMQPKEGDAQENNPFPTIKGPGKTEEHPLVNLRPNLETMPQWYKDFTEGLRDQNKDIRNLEAPGIGVAAGLAPEFFGGKKLAKAEAAVTKAQTALESAQRATQASSGVSSAEKIRLAEEVSKLEKEYRASLASQQALERELAEATKESTRYLSLEEQAARIKDPTKSGSYNYGAKTPGQLPPEAMLNQIEDYTSGKNPRGRGAWDISAKNAQNIENQGRLGMGDWRITGTGSEQLVLSPDEIAKRRASMDAATKRIETLSPNVDAAKAETARADELRKEAEKLRQRGNSSMATEARTMAGEQARTAAELEAARKAAPGAAGWIGSFWQKVPGAQLLSGFGAGFSATEALNRYEKGDTSGAVLSTLQVLLDAMAMIPPGTPPTAILKSIGVAGGLATTAFDLYRTHRMEGEERKAKVDWGTGKDFE